MATENMNMRSVGHVEKMIHKKRLKRKVRIQVKKSPRPFSFTLQRLFDCCQRVFVGTGEVPSSMDVQKMCRIIDDMRPEDVGLTMDLQFFQRKSEVEGNQSVTSATIYKCDNFELCLFLFPAKAVIPLHNHPGMTVFSKLLSGTMHIKAYDWVDPSNSTGSKLRLAKLTANRTFTAPSDASVLYPTSGGNIHEFRAITPCVLLDVIGPPYSGGSYYKDTPCTGLSSEVNEQDVKIKADEDDNNIGYGWLEEIERPEDSDMVGIVYQGPQIITNATYS